MPRSQHRPYVQFFSSSRVRNLGVDNPSLALKPQGYLPIGTQCQEVKRLGGEKGALQRGSMSFPEIAVTSLRGLMRNDSASSQFLNPEITRGLPFITAR